jgi:hypothetical protein
MTACHAVGRRLGAAIDLQLHQRLGFVLCRQRAAELLHILSVLLCVTRELDDEAIKAELTRFKGVGAKTVACVLMFCLERPEFPVDVHVRAAARAGDLANCHSTSQRLQVVPCSCGSSCCLTAELCFICIDIMCCDMIRQPVRSATSVPSLQIVIPSMSARNGNDPE